MTFVGCSAGKLFRGLLCAICLVVLCASLPGQAVVSTIRGSIADPSGAAAGNVGVEVVNIATNIRRSVTGTPASFSARYAFMVALTSAGPP